MLAILFAVGLPLVFLYLIWTLEIFAVSRISGMVLSFGWGIASFAVAFVLQTGLLQNGSTFEQISLYVAPPLEEALKAGLIVFLLYRQRLPHLVDGLSYGFAIGTGFAICENLFYVTRLSGTALPIGLPLTVETAIARSFSVSLMHAFNTALIGAGAGGSLYFTRFARVRRTSFAYLVTVGVHAGFNYVASNAEGTWLLIFGFIVGLGGTGVIILLINRSLTRERAEMERALRGSLSVGERAAALDQQAILATVSQTRGELGLERAKLVAEYICLQAEKRLLQGTVEANRRARYASTLKDNLAELDTRIARLRDQLGLYTLLWLRGVMPSEESDLWQLLGKALHDHPPIMQLIKLLNERQAALSPDEVARREVLLAKTALFGKLPEEERGDIALLLHSERRQVDEVVLERGAPDERLYIVAEGALVASIIKRDSGETVLSSYHEGEVFGELGIIDGREHPATISAAEEVLLYTLSRADLLALLHAKPQMSVELMRELVEQIRRQIDLLMWVRQASAEPASADAPLPIAAIDPLKGMVATQHDFKRAVNSAIAEDRPTHHLPTSHIRSATALGE